MRLIEGKEKKVGRFKLFLSEIGHRKERADVNLANRNGQFGDGKPSQFGKYFCECSQCGKFARMVNVAYFLGRGRK